MLHLSAGAIIQDSNLVKHLCSNVLIVSPCFIYAISLDPDNDHLNAFNNDDFTLVSVYGMNAIDDVLTGVCHHVWAANSIDARNKIEPVHDISNNVVCSTSKASDQPAHTRSLIRAFASRLSIL